MSRVEINACQDTAVILMLLLVAFPPAHSSVRWMTVLEIHKEGSWKKGAREQGDRASPATPYRLVKLVIRDGCRKGVAVFERERVWVKRSTV